MRNNKGFSLLEVLVAMTILAFMAYMTSNSIRQATTHKKKIQSKIDSKTALNNALKIIEDDISAAFHYHDLNYEMLREIEKENYEAELEAYKKKYKGKANPPPPPKPPENNLVPPKNITHFLGQESELHFTNLKNIRTQANSQESDQQEVGYFLKSCKSFTDPDKSSTCLWRRSSPFLDEKTDEGGDEVALLENVKTFSLRYFGKQKEDWVNTWETDKSGTLKDIFPQAVEVTLVVDDNKKKLSAIRVIGLSFPNNKKEEKKNARRQ